MTTRSPLRVAMVGLRAPWGTEGGIELAVGELAPRLVARGCAVTVYCRRRYNPLPPGIHQGVRLVDLDTIYSKHLEAFVHTALAAPRASLRHDLVHIHATGPALFGWIPRLARRGVVVSVHGLDWQRDKWDGLARRVLQLGAWSAARFPHQVIAVGRHLQDHYQERYGIQAACVPNGVGEIPWQPLERGGLPELVERGFLLYVGRLVPEKGLERLIAGYRMARPELPLVIVGGSTHMEDYAQKLRDQAPPGVIFAGSRYGAQRDALLSHARCFVLPSHLEGFPLAPLEAMAAGCPVLLSDIAPHQEIVSGEPALGACLVTADGWAGALQEVCQRPWSTLSQLGEIGRAHVRAHFSWDRCARETLAVYQQALGQPAGAVVS